MDREKIVEEIIMLEWDMFHSVSNIGGKAPCQEDLYTFRIMRGSQLAPWSENMQKNWLFDLRNAKVQGRNLMTEKYARMMEFTAKEEYDRIKDQLPAIPEEAVRIVSGLTEMTVRFAEEFKGKYPYLSGTGRPIRKEQDSAYATSLETYTRGELLTYSLDTLRIFEAFYKEKAEKGESIYEETLEQTVKRLGYQSLQEAENKQRARVEGK